jgi:uncharacterized protein (DUF2147 family)
MRIFVTAAVLIAVATPVQAATSITGRWFTDNKDSIIEIAPCGTALCGRVARIIAPTPDGKPAIDSNNPDPKLRNRPILGMTLLSGFRDSGKEWSGQIYDPRAGRTYRSTMQRQANGTLKVKGCWGPFCRSVIFTPAS